MIRIIKFFIFLFSILLLTACGGSDLPAENETPPTSEESDFCSTSTSYSPGVVVSGTAKFRRRGLNLAISGGIVTTATTGSVIATALPIKYAEIRMLDSGGNTVQCGTTNSLGELKALDGSSDLLLPNPAGTYTFKVYARANFTFPSVGKPTSATLNASVKEDIYANEVYTVSGTLTSNGSGGASNSPINLVAQADEAISKKIEGGAFNIYNDWVTAFEYLTSTSNTSNLDVSCLNQRLDMFWQAGFNPATYLDPEIDPNSTLSFYLRDYNELYICGGVTGNVSTADTDHFDDAVILHEMGHHIEKVCGRMDSPGGQHFALYRIDPRLAWSEAWGNFMGGHILKNNTVKINPNLPAALPNGEWLHYNDTKGYGAGGTSLIMMRLNKAGDGSETGSDFDVVNPVTNPGESHVREGSIARGLFKAANTCNNCGGGITFDKFWKALGTTADGIGFTPFSSSAKFFAKVYEANGSSFSASMTTIMENDETLHMVGDAVYSVSAATSSTGTVATNAWPGYGIALTTSSSCYLNLLQPRNTAAALTTYADQSDQRFTNHFYSFKKSDLSGVTQIRLVPDSTCSIDIDLVVFNEDYAYNEDCSAYSGANCTTVVKTTSDDVPTYSRSSSALSPPTVAETINLSALGTGNYLLNVRGYKSTPETIDNNSKCVYKLTDQNGSTLCPSTSY